MTWTEREAREHVARTEELLSGLTAVADTAARDRALDALQALAEMYGECLARVMGSVDEAARSALADDELVGHLLLVHELHPETAGQRVRRALEDVLGVTVVSADESAVRVRIAPQGCGSPPAEQLARTVRDAVARAAPEVPRVETEEAAPEPSVIPVDSLFRKDGFQGAAAQPAGKR
ncbi:nitrogen fixation protein NifU [Streptomyces sp. HNM0575]|uniref:nitrogen fixation protein NifU n=1 Tax=Streptomyces sp. HNM0575 TaxID=2716338 RepID=UPI00145F9883|nr:nitrogen fixation protein NifU [Streptomyces sp. HNM0575]NLU75379.1 nitrogen fixation protein NifU [Streptomyces sp. HNM0575]